MRVTPIGQIKTNSAFTTLPPDDPDLLADIEASKSIDISQCQTVCLALGPYRNLTSLTAATLFLHPNCQVLNHAGMRVFASPQLDFFLDYSTEKMNRFMRYAIHISAQGESGKYGGSILHSPAFDSPHPMKGVFENSGGKAMKPLIQSLFWKESLITDNHIRDNHIDLARLFAVEPRLRFLLPIRNPMDCAKSNLTSELVKQFPGISENPPFHEIMEAILNEIYWVAELKERFPSRILYFFEHSLDTDLLQKTAHFLKLEPKDTWIQQALSALEIKKGYLHDDRDWDWYRQTVSRRFSRFPALCVNLMRFASKPK